MYSGTRPLSIALSAVGNLSAPFTNIARMAYGSKYTDRDTQASMMDLSFFQNDALHVSVLSDAITWILYQNARGQNEDISKDSYVFDVQRIQSASKDYSKHRYEHPFLDLFVE